MKDFHTTVRYYGGNFQKIKARFIPSKRPVKNWHYKKSRQVNDKAIDVEIEIFYDAALNSPFNLKGPKSRF
jgi:hypothetical protein